MALSSPNLSNEAAMLELALGWRTVGPFGLRPCRGESNFLPTNGSGALARLDELAGCVERFLDGDPEACWEVSPFAEIEKHEIRSVFLNTPAREVGRIATG